MKIEITGETMIFRKDFNDRALYSTTIGKKNKDGEWDNAYIDVKFKNGVELENKTKIDITNGWLTFYKNKDGKTVWQIFVSEFDGGVPSGFEQLDDDLDNSDIPF